MNFDPPPFGAPMEPAHPSPAARRLLALRRSAAADLMTDPGPDPETLASILKIAARVPDHRRVTPFRFIVFRGDARARAGELLAAAFARAEPEAETARVEVEARRFLRAPVVIGVVARIDCDHRTPEWEQMLTNGAVCMTMLLAASAYGFAGQWLTEWCAYDRGFCEGIGLTATEKIAGFIYLGTAAEAPRERQRPVMDEIVSVFDGGGRR